MKSQRNENLSQKMQNYIQHTHKKVIFFYISCMVLWKVLYSSNNMYTELTHVIFYASAVLLESSVVPSVSPLPMPQMNTL